MKKTSLKMGFLNTSFIIIALTLFIVGITEYFSISKFAEVEAGKEAKGIATSVSKLIVGDKFLEVIREGKTNSYYEELRVQLNNTLKETGVLYLSTIIVNGDRLNFIVDGTDKNSEDFSDYMDEGEVSNERLKEAIENKKSAYSEIYKDPTWGQMVSAVVPIKTKNGEIVAWVQADIAVKEIENKINFFALRLIISLSFALIIVYAMINYIKRNIAKPIEKFVESFQKMVTGDFNSKVEFKQKGIFQLLAVEYNMLVDTVGEIIGTVKNKMESINEDKDRCTFDMDNVVNGSTSIFYKESSNKIQEGLKQQIAYLHEMVDGVTEQNASTQNALASIEEMNASIKEIGNFTKETKESSDKAIEIAKESYTSAGNLNKAMNEINSSVKNVNEKIDELMTMSDSIGGIVVAIQSISERTNLLALNAAIEAARAGDAGRGFSVVADEIRKLAEQTNRETDKISDIVTNVRKEIIDVKNTNDIVDAKIVEGNVISESVKNSINSILQITEENNHAIGSITHATTEQGLAIEEITRNIEIISGKSEEIDMFGNNLSNGMKIIEDTINEKLKNLYEIKNNLDKVNKEMEFFK